MGKKYQIWDKVSDVYTPSGEVFTPAEWIEKYTWINIPGARMVLDASDINGGLCMNFNQWVEQYRNRGCDIPDSILDDSDAVIAAIEAFEDAEAEEAKERAEMPTAEDRIASQLELQNLYTEAQMMGISID